jgi:hypothetical protein
MSSAFVICSNNNPIVYIIDTDDSAFFKIKFVVSKCPNNNITLMFYLRKLFLGAPTIFYRSNLAVFRIEISKC